MPPRDERYPVLRIFSRFFAPSKSSFSSRVFRTFDTSTPMSIVQSPGTARLRRSPRTSQHHSNTLLAAYRLMSGSSPLVVAQPPSPPSPRHHVHQLPDTFFAPQCTLLSGCAHLGRGRTAPTPPFPFLLSVFAPRQWPSRVDTPLVMSPLTGSGFGQVSPGVALVRLREASVSVDTPAFRAPPRF
ncbi:hypothetical protein VTO73DRAFT_13393 [Trametes versicolor]